MKGLAGALLIAPLLAAAADPADLDGLDALLDGDGEASRLRLEVRGRVGLEGRIYVQDRSRASDHDQQAIAEARATLEVTLGRSWGAQVVPWVLIDVLDPELLRYEPLEAYLFHRAERWDVLVGQFVDNWGAADLYNPLAVLNRTDLGVDLIDGVRRGELGTRIRWTAEDGPVVAEPSVSLYVLPVWRRTELPTADSRFAFRRLDEGRAPSFAEGLLVGARYESTLSSATFNADVQVVGARGPERLFAVTEGDDETLQASYFGSWTIGGGIRAVPNAEAWSKLTFKAELAVKLPYRLNASAAIPSRHAQYVVGFDRSFSSVFTAGDRLVWTLEWLGEVGPDDDLSYLRPFRSDLGTRLAWDANDFDRTQVEVVAIADARNGETIATLKIRRKLSFVSENLGLELSARWLRAAPSEPTLLWSFYTRNSDVRARLQWAF